MDALYNAISLNNFRAGRQPKSLVEWNVQYEAMTFENDWWFRAARAFIGQARNLARTLASSMARPTPALRAAYV